MKRCSQPYSNSITDEKERNAVPPVRNEHRCQEEPEHVAVSVTLHEAFKKKLSRDERYKLEAMLRK